MAWSSAAGDGPPGAMEKIRKPMDKPKASNLVLRDVLHRSTLVPVGKPLRRLRLKDAKREKEHPRERRAVVAIADDKVPHRDHDDIARPVEGSELKPRDQIVSGSREGDIQEIPHSPHGQSHGNADSRVYRDRSRHDGKQDPANGMAGARQWDQRHLLVAGGRHLLAAGRPRCPSSASASAGMHRDGTSFGDIGGRATIFKRGPPPFRFSEHGAKAPRRHLGPPPPANYFLPFPAKMGLRASAGICSMQNQIRMPRLPSALGLSGACGGSRNWEDGRSTGKVFSGLRRMSEDSGAGTQPGSCGPQEGIPGASLDSSGSGRGPGSLMSSRPVARRRNRYSGSSSGAGDGEGHGYLGAYAAVAALVRTRCMAQSQESQESTEMDMDMVPGPEVVRTLSFVDQEALGGAARVGNPTVGQGAISDVDGLDVDDGAVAAHSLMLLERSMPCSCSCPSSSAAPFPAAPAPVPFPARRRSFPTPAPPAWLRHLTGLLNNASGASPSSQETESPQLAVTRRAPYHPITLPVNTVSTWGPQLTPQPNPLHRRKKP
eukprot:scaffold3560_cov124-Isochrysis_galbana.AAC.1